MKIQANYLVPLYLGENQLDEENFRFYGVISLPALPTQGMKLWEYCSNDPDTATVKIVRIVSEEGAPSRLTYEVDIVSDEVNLFEWHDFFRWFRERVEWLFSLGLSIVDYPGQDDNLRFNTMEKFDLKFNREWYDDLLRKTLSKKD